MRLRTKVNRRVIVMALCLCLAGTGCDAAFDFSTGTQQLSNGFMVDFATTLPNDTCAVVLLSWFSSEGPGDVFSFCDDLAGRRRHAQDDASRFLRAADGSGAFVVDTLVIEGTVAGSKLPRWTAILSSTPGGAGAGTSSALTTVSSVDGDGDPTGAVPAKILATLYDVNRKGKRKKAGKKQARFDKKTGGASVLFDDLAGARDHYEIDLIVKGGKVTDGTVNYAASTATSPSARVGAISGRWDEDRGSRAGATLLTTWAGIGFTSAGKTAAGKVPKATIVAYPEQTSRVAGRSATVDIIGLAMQGDADLAPPKQQLKKIQFTLYAVDAKGKRTKLATKTGAVTKKNGVALVLMEGVAAPASHYEIDAKALGGKMQNSNLSVSAILAPAGIAGRALMSPRIAEVQSLPPLVDRSAPPGHPDSNR